MFIAHLAGKSSLAPEERNVLLSEAKYFAPPELQSCLGSWFYKHLVPPGLKTSRPKINRLIRCENFRDTTLAQQLNNTPANSLSGTK